MNVHHCGNFHGCVCDRLVSPQQMLAFLASSSVVNPLTCTRKCEVKINARLKLTMFDRIG